TLTTPSKSTYIMYKGTVKTFKYKMSPKKATKKVKWTSSKTSIATVSASGKVTAKGVGVTNIQVKAKYGKGSDKVKLTVQDKLTKVTFSGKVEVGGTLTANCTPAAATVKYQWYRNNVAIAAATAAKYILTSDDLGKTIKVKAIGTGYYTGTVESSPVMSRVDAKSLKGDVVVAVNTSSDEKLLSKVGTLPAGYDDDSIVQNLKTTKGFPIAKPKDTPLTFDQSKQIVGRNNSSVTYKVGDTKNYTSLNFYMYYAENPDPSEPEYIDATVEMTYAGKYCTIWRQTSPFYKKPDLLSKLKFGENKEIDKKIADEYDKKIMALVKNTYGDLYDADNDGKFAIFCIDAVDLNNYDMPQGSLLTGYCNPADAEPVAEGGMGMDIMVLDLWPTLFDNDGNLNEKDWTFAMQTVTHEMAHYAHASYSKLNPGSKYTMPSWLTESLATFAETMYAGRGEYPDHSMYRYYKNDPTSLVANGRSPFEFWGAEEDYALVNMFSIYLYEQTKNLKGGGYELLGSIVESNDEGSVAIENCLKKIGYPVTNFSDLVFNFRVAITANEDSGVYSFNKNEAVQNYPIHIYKNEDKMADNKTIPGGGAITFKNAAGGFVPAGNDQDVRFAAVTLEK
ncbi:MAG: Ig-like domain-containing protein, partial [Anaerovoracaceae bacterium]